MYIILKVLNSSISSALVLTGVEDEASETATFVALFDLFILCLKCAKFQKWSP